MQQGPRLIQLKTAKRPDVITPRSVEQFIEENSELYLEQTRELEKEYDGKLVTDKATCSGLLRIVQSYVLRTGGLLPDLISPSNCPGDEYIPVRLSFRIHSVGIDADKWFFFKRSKIFVLNPGAKT